MRQYGMVKSKAIDGYARQPSQGRYFICASEEAQEAEQREESHLFSPVAGGACGYQEPGWEGVLKDRLT